jgi:hypothetical protein
MQAAESGAQQALALAKQLQGQRPHSLATGRAWLALAQAQQGLGTPELARQSAGQARTVLDASVGPEHPLSQRASRLVRSLDG